MIQNSLSGNFECGSTQDGLLLLTLTRAEEDPGSATTGQNYCPPSKLNAVEAVLTSEC